MQSNGHGRGIPGRETAQISNFVVKADKDAKSYEELKQELIKLAKDERLDYGIMIKQLSGNQGAIGTPVLTYKVYVADGREELVRGATRHAHGTVPASHSGCWKRLLYCQSSGWNQGLKPPPPSLHPR
jgi:hypothetical protein